MLQKVELIYFPETPVAALEHHGPEHLVHNTSKKFIEWRKANGVSPNHGATYGIHYADHHTTAPEAYRLDICVSVSAPVAANPQGVINKVIPGGNCAKIRHVGARHNMNSVVYLLQEWLPASGKKLRDFPVYFHYVNVGPAVQDHAMITDIYLPLL